MKSINSNCSIPKIGAKLHIDSFQELTDFNKRNANEMI